VTLLLLLLLPAVFYCGSYTYPPLPPLHCIYNCPLWIITAFTYLPPKSFFLTLTLIVVFPPSYLTLLSYSLILFFSYLLTPLVSYTYTLFSSYYYISYLLTFLSFLLLLLLTLYLLIILINSSYPITFYSFISLSINPSSITLFLL
jgi:hypothetical protein